MRNNFETSPVWFDVEKIEYVIIKDSGDNDDFICAIFSSGAEIKKQAVFQLFPFANPIDTRAEQPQPFCDKDFMDWYQKIFVAKEGVNFPIPQVLVNPSLFSDNNSRIKALVNNLQHISQSMLFKVPKSILINRHDRFASDLLEVNFDGDNNIYNDSRKYLFAKGRYKKFYLSKKGRGNKSNYSIEEEVRATYYIDRKNCWLSLMRSSHYSIKTKYGRINVRNYLYEKFYNKILEKNKILTNNCGNKICMNPEHLQLMSCADFEKLKALKGVDFNINLALEKNKIKEAIELYNLGNTEKEVYEKLAELKIIKKQTGRERYQVAINYFKVIRKTPKNDVARKFSKTIINDHEWQKRRRKKQELEEEEKQQKQLAFEFDFALKKIISYKPKKRYDV